MLFIRKAGVDFLGVEDVQVGRAELFQLFFVLLQGMAADKEAQDLFLGGQALAALASGEGDAKFYEAKLVTARFFAERFFAERFFAAFFGAAAFLAVRFFAAFLATVLRVVLAATCISCLQGPILHRTLSTKSVTLNFNKFHYLRDFDSCRVALF